MRVLFVAPYVPSRIRVRPYHWIRALAGLGCHVHLVALSPPEDRASADTSIFGSCGSVDVFPLSRARTLVNGVKALASSVPLQAAYSRHSAAEARIRELAWPDKFDVVHIEHLRGSLLVPAPCAIPTVYDAVDSITRLFEQTVRLAPTSRQRALARLDVGRTRRFESRVTQRFDRVAVSSEAEARAFRELAGDESLDSVCAIRNGVELHEAPGAPADDGRTVLFAGKMSYHANEAAARRLIEQVMPLVWRARPDARLVVAGKDPSQALQRLAVTGRIDVTGYVDDLRAVMSASTVLAAPLVYAAGIQNKVLEAMACGVPVVTGSSACAALAAKVGTDVLAADDDPQFAAEVVHLLDDRRRRDAVGAAGRVYVERHHDWSVLATELMALYAEAQQAFHERAR